MFVGKVVKVRSLKAYATAHSHVSIGDVLEETPQYLVLLCKTYHFGTHVGGGGRIATLRQGEYVCGVLESEKSVRAIPWSQIEVINELPTKTNWDVKAYIDRSGTCCLANEQKTVITRPPARDT